MRFIFALLASHALAACPDIAPGQYRGALGYERFVTVTKTAGSNEFGVEVSSMDGEEIVSESSTLEYTIEADCSFNVAGLSESYGTVRYDASNKVIAVGNLFLERV